MLNDMILSSDCVKVLEIERKIEGILKWMRTNMEESGFVGNFQSIVWRKRYSMKHC